VSFWGVVAQVGADWLMSKSSRSPKPKTPYRTIEQAMAEAGRTPTPATPEGTSYMSNTIIPPGGMAGFLQMTPASKLALTGGRMPGKRRKKRARKAKAARSPKRRASGTGRKKARLVKGSAAAKRFMANLRKRRK